jgi:hypothetical protein
MRRAAALAAVAALPPLYRAAVRAMLRRNIRAINAGDPGPLFASYADDVHFAGRSPPRPPSPSPARTAGTAPASGRP